jgi:hypothetical protein
MATAAANPEGSLIGIIGDEVIFLVFARQRRHFSGFAAVTF